MTLPRTGAWVDTLRLTSGLTLFAFALAHFLNHALGLWSLEAMAAGQRWLLAVTHSVLGTAALALALVAHLALALWRVARLKTWALPRATLYQLASGAAISVALMPHLFQAGIGPREASAVMTYPGALSIIWPDAIRLQTFLLLLVWTHGCVGLHQWLKHEPWWRRATHALIALAVVIPAAALAGVEVAGREVERMQATLPYNSADRQALIAQAGHAEWIAVALVSLAVAVALGSAALARRRRRLAISYDPGPKVLTAPGPTLLEISRAHRVPHLSICGGKARCSTCRVRVLAGGEGLEPPSEAEAKLLQRIGADAGVRLACQIRPTDALTVCRLLSPEAAAPALIHGVEAAGVIRIAAVLFIDLRGFTRLSEAKLAFDVVYILNAFFEGAGRAVEASGGVVDKYMGDGMMAVFDHADGLPAATRNALSAIAAIDAALHEVNGRLAREIGAPLALAMGLHGGRVVSGRIGYGEAGRPTVIGRVVNIASRLESLAKTRDVELAISRDCVAAAGLDASALAVESADIRGLDAAFPVVLAPRAAEFVKPVKAATRAT